MTTRLFFTRRGEIAPTGTLIKETQKVFTGSPLGEGGVTIINKRVLIPVFDGII